MSRRSQYHSTATRSPFVYKNGELFDVDDFAESSKDGGARSILDHIASGLFAVDDNARDELDGLSWSRRRSNSSSSTVSSGSTMTLTPRDTFGDMKALDDGWISDKEVTRGTEKRKSTQLAPMASPAQRKPSLFAKNLRGADRPTYDTLAQDNYLGLIVSSNLEAQRLVRVEALASASERRPSLPTEPSLKHHRAIKRKPVPISIISEAPALEDSTSSSVSKSLSSPPPLTAAALDRKPKAAAMQSPNTSSCIKHSDQGADKPIVSAMHVVNLPSKKAQADKKPDGKGRWMRSMSLRRQRSEQPVSSPRQVMPILPMSASLPFIKNEETEEATPKMTWTRSVDPEHMSTPPNTTAKAVSRIPPQLKDVDADEAEETHKDCDSPHSDIDALFSPSPEFRQLGDSSPSSHGSTDSHDSSHNSLASPSFSRDLYKALPPLPTHFGRHERESSEERWRHFSNDDMEGSAAQQHERRIALQAPTLAHIALSSRQDPAAPQKTSDFYSPLFAAMALDMERQLANDATAFTTAHAPGNMAISSSSWIDGL